MLWWKRRQKKPQHSFVFSLNLSSWVSLCSDCRLWQTGTAVAVRLLARRWGVCYYGSVLPSVCLVVMQSHCLLHHMLTNNETLSLCQRPWAKAPRQVIAAGWSSESKSGSWLQGCCIVIQIPPVKKKASVMGSRQKEKGLGETEEGNSMCFWLIWHSYFLIHHRCFHTTLRTSLLAYISFIHPATIPSALLSSILFSTNFFPCLTLSPSPPLILALLPSLTRLACWLPNHRPSCEGGRLCLQWLELCRFLCSSCHIFLTFLLLPHSTVSV